MRSLPTQIREFQECFEVPKGDPVAKLICIQEEIAELSFEIEQGSADEDLAKEAVDVVYTIVGLFVDQGWDFEAAFEEVHRSNMSKLGADGKPIHRADGKVLKGPSYSPADLRPAIGAVSLGGKKVKPLVPKGEDK